MVLLCALLIRLSCSNRSGQAFILFQFRHIAPQPDSIRIQGMRIFSTPYPIFCRVHDLFFALGTHKSFPNPHSTL